MTDGSRVTLEDTRAPSRHYRVICWRVREGRDYESFIDGDFADRAAAKARAKQLAVPDVLWTVVYDHYGIARHNYVLTSKANFALPMPATRLAGFTDPEDRLKRGTYKRR